jgi:transcriptional regulator with XRE-family HTH domain
VDESSELRRLLAHRIRELRARRRKTTVALAGLAGVSAAHLYDVVGCKKAATVDFIEKIAGALGVQPWQLLRGEEPLSNKEMKRKAPRPVRPQRVRAHR